MTDGWRPIETAPTDGTVILVWGSGGHDIASVWWWANENKPEWFNGDVVVYPTHWRDLPAAPLNEEVKPE